MNTRGSARLALVAIGIVGAAEALAAQRPGSGREDRSTWVSLMAGPAPYDIAGTGTGFAAALRFEVPSGRIWVVEPSIGIFRFRSTLGDRISYLMPEVGLQVQPPSGRIRPYLGAGAGISEYLSGRGSTFGTLHAAAGLRLRLGDWGARGDVRIRSIDPFTQTTTDFTFGVSKRLGR